LRYTMHDTTDTRAPLYAAFLVADERYLNDPSEANREAREQARIAWRANRVRRAAQAA
jgi:hypothetical protein